MFSRTWAKAAIYLLILGWFPFIWLSVYGSWNREIGVIVAAVGIIILISGSMLTMPLLKDEDLFKSIEELEKERALLSDARKRLIDKIESI